MQDSYCFIDYCATPIPFYYSSTRCRIGWSCIEQMLVYFPSRRLVNVLDAGESSTLMFALLFVFALFRMLRSFGFA
jgi:hypothetical protein